MDMMLNDSPSPVDLSMPPPAQPASASPSALDEDVGMPMLPPTNVNVNGSGSGGGNSHLVPVTPASIMGIGKSVMQSRTAAGAGAGNGNENRAGDDTAASRTRQQRTNVFKAAAIPTSPAPVVPDAPSTSTRSKAPKRKATTDPQSTPTTSAVPSTSSSSGAAEPAPSGPVEAVRKTTHKDAEQKRRDSMKNKFDELRSLLPIIPLPSDENYPHSSSSSSKPALLPGALPPRGPPKAGQEGPNKAVSRLQLLVCGNEFIRTLKGRVERRDEEVGRLRREVERLRGLGLELGIVGGGMGEGEGVAMYGDENGEEWELWRDLDVEEEVGMGMEDGEDGEEG